MTSENPLNVYIQVLDNLPSPNWSRIDGTGNIGEPAKYGPGGDYHANDVGTGVWQIVNLQKNQFIVLKIPDSYASAGIAWSIRPLKYRNNKPCNGAVGDCGMPILIESGEDMVGDMSAVDGVNFLCKYQMTAKKGVTTIDMKNNPCKAIDASSYKGCRNPATDGIFKNDISPCYGPTNPKENCQTINTNNHCWCSAPCPAGTCNLTGPSKTWCDAIHDGQCANSSSTWIGQNGTSKCSDNNLFTTYCYSHDDGNSSPHFSSPYKMQITYKDLN